MRIIKLCYCLILCFNCLFLFSTFAFSEYYKYIDEQGNVKFTDDASSIPESYRQQAEKYDSFEPEEQKLEIDKQGNEEIIDYIEKRAALKKTQAVLEKEYKELINAKQKFDKLKEGLSNSEDIQIFRNKIKELNKKIEQFELKRVQFEEELKKINLK